MYSQVGVFVCASIFTCGLLAGCSSTPAQPEIKTVQAIQVGDDTLDCSALQSQIFESERVVSALTQELESAKTAAKTNETVASIGSYLGAATWANSLMASSERDTVAEKREVRDSYQRRRDILLQQYMHKQCSVRSEPDKAVSGG